MKSILVLFIFFVLFLNIVLEALRIEYVYNSDNYVNVHLDDTTISTAQIFINGLDVTSYCLHSSAGLYGCNNLPDVAQVISGNIRAINGADTTPDYPFFFTPQISQIVYPSGTTRLPTTGGTITINGRYFDKTTFSGTTNNLRMFYRTIEVTDYSLVNRNQIVVNIPPGTGGLGTGRLDNPLYLSCVGNQSLDIMGINYNPPSIEKNIEFDGDTGYMTIRGSDFGTQPELLTIYACNLKIPTVQVTTPHTAISALYEPNVFYNRSCSYILVGVNGLNSTIDNYGVLILPPKIIAVSTPPVQGGQIEVLGSYLSNQFVGVSDLYWRILINGVELDSKSCTSIDSWRLVCNSPPGTFGTNLPVQVKVSSKNLLSNIYNVPYSQQSISSISKLYYTQPGTVTINGANFFKNSLAVSIGGARCSQEQYIDINTISCFYDASVLPNKNGLMVSVNSINGYAEIPNAFQYLPALFTNVIQSNGDNVQLVGNYFSPDMSVTIGSQDISSYCKTDSLTSITCTHIPNVASGDIVILGGDSSTFSSFVLTPFVLQSSNSQIPTIGSTITLTGKFFELKVNGEQTQTLSILINGEQEYNSELTLLDNSNIQFTMPPGKEDSKVNTIAVKSKDKVSNSIQFVYIDYVKIQSVIQVGEGLNIKGFGFKLSSDNLIKFGQIDITSSCLINSDTDITCQTLPEGVESGYLTISSSSGASNYLVYLTPVIKSISKSILDSSGEVVSITGRYFEQIDQTTQIANNINVYIDNNPNPMPTTVQNSNLILSSISGGFGAIHNLFVNTEGRISNPISYSYNPPIVNSFYQVGEEFHINADHFSRDNLLLNKIYINDMPAITLLATSETDYNELIFSIPSTAQNGILVLEVDGQKSNPFDIYLEPIIKSLSPIKPYMDGSIDVTVNILYFSNINYKTNNNIQLDYSYTLESSSTDKIQLDCTYLNSLSVKCSNFKGNGNGTLVVSKMDGSDNKISNSFGFSFQNPKVIKSTSLYYQKGSNITITAESFTSNSLQVSVEGVECLNPVALDNRHIECYYDASVPPKDDDSSLNITIISNSMVGSNKVLYYHETFKCENNCTSPENGECNTINGECKCTALYEGIDCSIKKQDPLPKPELNENGESNIVAKLNFTVSIAYLRELDINGLDVKVLDMKSIQWTNSSSNGKQSYFKGIFKNDPAVVELDVNYYSESLDYDFAGDIIQIPSNSIKYIITVSNWEFQSKLNSFQLIYNAQTVKQVNTGCQIIETNSTESTIQEQSASWFQISAGTSILNGKFARRIFADEQVKKSTIKILPLNDPIYKFINESSSASNLYNKLTAINTPYFNNNVKLDPSFNSLIRPSENDNCSKQKWKIPVIAALCSVGGVAILTAVVVTIIKKQKHNLFLKKIKTLSNNSN